MKYTHMALLTAAAIGLVTRPARADDWQEWRGPNRDGVSVETNWLVNWPPDVVWTANVQRGYGSVAVYDGKLYAVGQNTNVNEDVVYCFDARNGTVLWTNTYLVSPVNSLYGNMATPAVTDGEVYTFSHDNQLRAWERFIGFPQGDVTFTTHATGYGVCASPLVTGETVVVNAGSFGTAVRTIPPYDTLWGDVEGTNSGYGSPVPLTVDGIPYIAMVNEASVLNLIPLASEISDRPTISFNCSSLALGTIYADPIAYSNRLFVCGTGGGAMLEIVGEPLYEAIPVWTKKYYEAIFAQYANCVIVGDYIYGLRTAYLDSAWVWCITCCAASDGTTQWNRKLSDEGLAIIDGGGGEYPSVMMVVVGDKLVLYNEDAQLSVIKASPLGFDREGRSWIDAISNPDPTGEFTPPVVADGLLYCRGAFGELICYQVGATNALPDTDHDDIPDTWEWTYFDSRDDCGPGLDYDKDGLFDDEEFIAGTVPTDINSVLDADIMLSNGKILVSCEGIAADGVEYQGRQRCYTLEYRTNLMKGAWQQVTGFIDVVGNDATIVHTNDMPVPSRFYRVKAKLKQP